METTQPVSQGVQDFGKLCLGKARSLFTTGVSKACI
jgi:hypothetical protein